MNSEMNSKIPIRRSSSVDERRPSTYHAAGRLYRTPSCQSLQSLQTPLTARPTGARSRAGTSSSIRSHDVNSKLSVPVRNTMSADRRAKSANSLTQQYMNLDRAYHLKRIKAFVMENEPKYEVLRPLTINTFVGVCDLLLSLLSDPSHLPITTENYMTEIPIRIKQMGYPITIATSFFKTPYTPQNFTHVLSIWTYLLDLVEQTSAKVTCLSDLDEAYFELAKLDETDSDEARAHLETAIYTSCGVTKEEVTMKNQQLDEQLQTERRNRDAWKQKRDQSVKKFDDQERELAALEIEMNGNGLKAAQKEYSKLLKQCEFDEERLDTVRKNERRMLAKLDEMRTKNSLTGHTMKQSEELDAQLEHRRRRLVLLRVRNEQCQLHNREENKRTAELSAEVLTRTFQHNTKLKLAKLPAKEKRGLFFDEREINLNTVCRDVAQVIANCKQLIHNIEAQNKILGVTLNVQSSELFSLSNTREEHDAERKRLQKEFKSNVVKMDDLMAEGKALEEDLDKEIPLVEELEKLMHLGLEKHSHEIALYNKRKSNLEHHMGILKRKYEDGIKFLKEQKLKLLQMDAEFAEQAAALVKSAIDAIPTLPVDD